MSATHTPLAQRWPLGHSTSAQLGSHVPARQA
jgi:hypothetical protein